MAETSKDMGCALKLWIAAAVVGFVVMVFLLLGDLSWLAAMFVGLVAAILVGMFLTWLICRPAERVRTAPATEPVDPVALVSGTAVPEPAPQPKARAAEPAPVATAEPAPVPVAAMEPAAETPGAAGEGIRPAALTAPRGGGADDLKMIKGVGPKLEQLLHELGFYHFDQVAGWSKDEVAWVDQNLKGFKGRVTRDDWVAQAKLLAEGGETAFSKKVGKGGVY
ncbi:MAG: hypothetical protein CL814_02940 [Confluentimicrobium sp.]|jgi:NADH-quinone oxidoreductase subunit E|uniref:hypothetical protein n=1 Tax=Actibacterium sp. TaxID=1872125 RepID=UPI000C5C59FA|nr:hypothetical protein [Actibacterium sp.]MBC55870.1 hypothetical protein [Actibacterium sp.]MDY6858282.1 hypothetical protein [Pseudomonadota bacterium]